MAFMNISFSATTCTLRFFQVTKLQIFVNVTPMHVMLKNQKYEYMYPCILIFTVTVMVLILIVRIKYGNLSFTKTPI